VCGSTSSSSSSTPTVRMAEVCRTMPQRRCEAAHRSATAWATVASRPGRAAAQTSYMRATDLNALDRLAASSALRSRSNTTPNAPASHGRSSPAARQCLLTFRGIFKEWSLMSDGARDPTERVDTAGGCPATTTPRQGSVAQRQPPALLPCGYGLPCLVWSFVQPSRSGCT